MCCFTLNPTDLASFPNHFTNANTANKSLLAAFVGISGEIEHIKKCFFFLFVWFHIDFLYNNMFVTPQIDR